MFCPNCGKQNQTPNTYCRQCGIFLPDFDKIKKREISPETHIQANTVLNVMSGIVSILLAFWLYVFILGDKNPPPFVIYITAGFLTAVFFWQAQVFWRNLQLKKQFPKLQKIEENSEKQDLIEPAKTKRFLDEADISAAFPASVTEYSTKNLKEKVRRSS